MKIDIADFSILTPFPGTPIYNNLEKENRLLTKDWVKYNMHNVVFQPKNMTPEDLQEGVIKLYNNFYSVNHTLKRITKSIKLGFYPFFLVLFRNTITSMGIKQFKKKIIFKN
jgi:radical SAM superfamily enzyme YgiQ (UPF0313 family)